MSPKLPQKSTRVRAPVVGNPSEPITKLNQRNFEARMTQTARLRESLNIKMIQGQIRIITWKWPYFVRRSTFASYRLRVSLSKAPISITSLILKDNLTTISFP
jgi:hypothetical protein